MSDMPRKKKTKVEVNNVSSLNAIIGEGYNDACLQISEAQSMINELAASTIMQSATNELSIDDLTKIAKEKGNLLKLKDSGIRIKLEIAKIQSDSIKNANKNTDPLAPNQPAAVTTADFKQVRDMINKAKAGITDEENEY
jgi:hypothetical protein